MLRTREAEDVVPALKRLQSALSPSFLPSPPLPVFQMLPQVWRHTGWWRHMGKQVVISVPSLVGRSAETSSQSIMHFL